jgi:large subunit ribosomal protein L13
MGTYVARPSDITRKWWVIDAKDLVLGRLAVIVAMRLRGKHKPTYTPSMDCGDHVVVINADKVALTGKKREDRLFYWHTGFPGGIKSRSMGKTLDSKHPERLLVKAVERMVPRTALGRRQMRKLMVYAGTEHPHVAQQPQALDVGSLNRKNKR